MVLAAGRSSRFGSDKLLANYRGKPLARHIADVLAAMEVARRFAVCPRGNIERADLFTSLGFEILWNDHPDDGIGHSLALGAARANSLTVGRLLVCLADMPNVNAAHLERLIGGDLGAIVATEVDGVRMPPVVFPRRVYPKLIGLRGDRGARALLADAPTIEAETTLARDIDARTDLGD